MTEKGKNKMLRGAVFTITGGILWGFSGTCGQYLMQHKGADAGWLTVVRMICAGVILLAVGFWRERDSMIGIWKNREDAFRLVLFAICGLMFCQFSYMKAIFYSNSGTATILQYLGPVLIMVISCVMAGKLPNKWEVLAIVLALTGTFLIATHGNIKNMALTPKGLAWGLTSAVSVSLYTMLPVRIMKKWGSIPGVGYGMVIGGIVLGLGTRFWNQTVPLDGSGLAALAAIILLGTAIAFTLYLTGVKEIGAVKGSMLASVEPVSSTVCMVVWLHSAFVAMDLAGFLCIFATIFLLAKE